MRFLIPVVLGLIGLGGGVGAGMFLSSPGEDETSIAPEAGRVEEVDVASAGDPSDPYRYVANKRREKTGDTEFVDFSRQFVVPVITKERMESLVVASISVEIAAGQAEAFFAKEPRLRDSMMQVMFDHANLGGFDGPFTNSTRLHVLRRNLLEAADNVVGDVVVSVLFGELARQDQP